jgi:ribonuclease P protein component
VIQAAPPDTLPTLKKRAEFLAVAKGGRMPRRAFVLQAVENPGPPRIGYTVTKKVGNAVERNRIRRRLRAAVRAASEAARTDLDYVLIGRRGALSQDFSELTGDIRAGLQRASTAPSAGPRHGMRGARSKSTPVPKKQG